MFAQLGRDEPAMSMDSSGKIIFARHNEVQQAVVGRDDVAKVRL